MIIGLTGTNAAGKGEVAKYLINKGFAYHSLSDILREEAARRGLNHTRENLIQLGNELRKDGGPGILAKMLKGKIGNKDIVDSVRNPAEIKELSGEPGFILIGVDAPVELRFQRAVKRKRQGDGFTLQEFKEKEAKENSDLPEAQQLNKCLELADARIINDKTLDVLYENIDKIIKRYASKTV
ncbi:MAG: AAA family ATPase [Candidatus Omnitrophica bacterium]|nr:AAA family ATPase [Candidatus Omnitrophota bacterium]